MYLLFDIGATKMRFAISRDGKRFLDPKIISTPKTFEEGVSLFRETTEALSKGEKIIQAAGGIAGHLNKERTRLVASQNLPGWVARPLKRELEVATHSPVYIENDTNMVGLGEVHYGAGRAHDIVVYMSISTGVGGSRFVGGHIDKSAFGFEPGQQIIDASGSLYPATRNDGVNTLEDLVSGKAFEKRYHKKPFEIIDLDIWEQAAYWLAYGLNNTIVHWSPDIIVLGGSMMTGAPGIQIDRVEFHLHNIIKIFPDLPRIEKARLGDEGGLWGALISLEKKMYS